MYVNPMGASCEGPPIYTSISMVVSLGSHILIEKQTEKNLNSLYFSKIISLSHLFLKF